MKLPQNPRLKSKVMSWYQRASCIASILAAAMTLSCMAGSDNRAPDVPDAIKVPGETNQVHFHVFAAGFQIYSWNGVNWVLLAPDAVLFSDAGCNGMVGLHYGGPTWETKSGSKVLGQAIANAPSPNPDSVPWLLVRAVSSEGPGILAGTSYIQRVNTQGGRAPTTPGTIVGELARIPYTAEYYFYHADN